MLNYSNIFFILFCVFGVLGLYVWSPLLGLAVLFLILSYGADMVRNDKRLQAELLEEIKANQLKKSMEEWNEKNKTL